MFQRDNRFPWITVVLGILASAGIVYAGIDIKISLDNRQEAREIGQQEGYRTAIAQAIQLAEQCKTVPIVMEGKEMVLYNVACPAQAPIATPPMEEQSE